MLKTELQTLLDRLDRRHPERIGQLVDVILYEALRLGANDVHFEPTHAALDVRFRLDGVLQTLAVLPRELAPNCVARLKVLAELLTYRLDIPQEGHVPAGRYGVDLRVSTFPTIHGEKAAVRIFDPVGETLELPQLGFDEAVLHSLTACLGQTSGAMLLTGPSGSGKTTTLYACLRHLVKTTRRHIVTIEDPVEQALEGVSQSQVRPGSEFDFARGLRSLLRQDPEVLMIGEVRDRDTAAAAVEAALTGHLVLSTLHAGSACGVLSRLLDMGVEPFLLTSGINAILNQRLVRKRCESCRGGGCEVCLATGFRGRLLLAEWLPIGHALRQAILAKADTRALETAAAEEGRQTLRDAAERAVAAGRTTRAEIERVLGPN